MDGGQCGLLTSTSQFRRPDIRQSWSNDGGAQLLDQKEAAHQQQQNNHDTREAAGLALGDLVVRVVIQPMVISIHSTLPLGRVLPTNALGCGAKQDKMAACSMFR